MSLVCPFGFILVAFILDSFLLLAYPFSVGVFPLVSIFVTFPFPFASAVNFSSSFFLVSVSVSIYIYIQMVLYFQQ